MTNPPLPSPSLSAWTPPTSLGLLGVCWLFLFSWGAAREFCHCMISWTLRKREQNGRFYLDVKGASSQFLIGIVEWILYSILSVFPCVLVWFFGVFFCCFFVVLLCDCNQFIDICLKKKKDWCVLQFFLVSTFILMVPSHVTWLIVGQWKHWKRSRTRVSSWLILDQFHFVQPFWLCSTWFRISFILSNHSGYVPLDFGSVSFCSTILVTFHVHSTSLIKNVVLHVFTVIVSYPLSFAGLKAIN